MKKEQTGETLHYSATFNAKVRIDYEVDDLNEELYGYVCSFPYKGISLVIGGHHFELSDEFFVEQFKRILKVLETEIRNDPV